MHIHVHICARNQRLFPPSRETLAKKENEGKKETRRGQGRGIFRRMQVKAFGNFPLKWPSGPFLLHSETAILGTRYKSKGGFFHHGWKNRSS